MSNESTMILDAAARIFNELADPQDILHGKSADWQQTLWQALDEMGLPQAWQPEEFGGHGISLADGLAVARAGGRAALAVPLFETMLAGWVCAQVNLKLPAGPASVIFNGLGAQVDIDAAGQVRASAFRVPFAREVHNLVLVSGNTASSRVAIIPRVHCTVEARDNLAGDPSDHVTIAASSVAFQTTTADVLALAQEISATLRSLQIAGALEALLDISVAYAMERVAFERPIAKFQAIQQNLARLGGEVAAAIAVAESAAATLSEGHATYDERLLEVASAKIRCGEAAELGCAIAHQVLGAIGFTEEHVLHRFSLRALSWRDEFGSETHWARQLGDKVRQGSAVDLWQLLSSR